MFTEILFLKNLKSKGYCKQYYDVEIYICSDTYMSKCVFYICTHTYQNKSLKSEKMVNVICDILSYHNFSLHIYMYICVCIRSIDIILK